MPPGHSTRHSILGNSTKGVTKIEQARFSNLHYIRATQASHMAHNNSFLQHFADQKLEGVVTALNHTLITPFSW